MIDKQADPHSHTKSVIGESLTHALRADNYARGRHVPSDPWIWSYMRRRRGSSLYLPFSVSLRKPLVFFRSVKLPDRVNESASTYVMRLK